MWQGQGHGQGQGWGQGSGAGARPGVEHRVSVGREVDHRRGIEVLRHSTLVHTHSPTQCADELHGARGPRPLRGPAQLERFGRAAGEAGEVQRERRCRAPVGAIAHLQLSPEAPPLDVIQRRREREVDGDARRVCEGVRHPCLLLHATAALARLVGPPLPPLCFEEGDDLLARARAGPRASTEAGLRNVGSQGLAARWARASSLMASSSACRAAKRCAVASFASCLALRFASWRRTRRSALRSRLCSDGEVVGGRLLDSSGNWMDLRPAGTPPVEWASGVPPPRRCSSSERKTEQLGGARRVPFLTRSAAPRVVASTARIIACERHGRSKRHRGDEGGARREVARSVGAG